MPSAFILNLVTRRNAIATELAALTMVAAVPGAKPNILSADGGTHIDHYKYKMSLYEELAQINKLIAADEATQAQIDDADGPAWEIETIGFPS